MPTIPSSQRFRKAHPCPICGGHDDAPRGQGVRCYGFLSHDGTFAHCTSEDFAGALAKNLKSDTYPHRLEGDCRCGKRHDPSLPRTERRRGAIPPKRQGRRIAATYDYTDAQGRVLYQVVRYDPKGFSQRQPNGPDAWINHLLGVPLVLYHYPEVREAIALEKTICIAEGEADVEALRRHGYVATCNSGGALKWTLSHANDLKGAADVVLFGDHDDKGRDHVAQVARSLRAVGITPRLAELDGLPEHGDVRDWLKTHGQEDLDRVITAAQPMAEESPERRFPRVDEIGYTLRTLQSLVIPDLQWAIEDLLPEGLAIIAGPPGLGKSMLLLQLALGVARGEKVLGVWLAGPGEVLYVGTEDNQRRMRDRVAQLMADEPTGAVWPDGFTVVHEIQPFGAGLVEQLEEWLGTHPRARLVIIDIFADIKPPRTPHSDWYQEERWLGKALDALAMRHHVCVLVSLHTNRLQHAEDPIDRVHGGSGLPGAAPTKTVLLPAQGFDKAIWHTRGRDTPREQHALTMVEGVWTYSGDGKVAQLTEERQAILRYFTLYPGYHTPQEVADALGKSRVTVTLLLRKLVGEGFLRKVGYGKYQLSGESTP
jgi:5S rRNA maturation endonuclease (ribonuclease M5)